MYIRKRTKNMIMILSLWIVKKQGVHMGIIDEWYTIFQKIKIPHGLILPVGLMSQTFELSFPAFTLARF